jgi:polysaccharide export outer membrane protein
MKKILFIVFIVLFAAVAFAGDYAIVPGDKLAVSVLGEQDLSRDGVLVRPDGKITLPQIGEVQAAGLTPTQLVEQLTSLYTKLVRKPEISVVILEGQNDKVYVIGSGVKSTVCELAKFKNLLQALASLDDLSLADLDQASLVRGNTVVLKGFRELYEDGDVSRNQELKSDDVIILPVRKDRYVYVAGAVNKPKTLPFHEGMTVLDAIMEADGFTKFASKNDTKVVRHVGGKEEVIPVKGKRLFEKGDITQNVELQRGDMVIVEEGFF